MRTKVILGSLLNVLVAGILGYLLVKSQVESNLDTGVQQRLPGDLALLERSVALSGYELEALVAQQADQRTMADVFGALGEGPRRQRAYEAAQRVAAWIADPARGEGGRPDVAAIVDDTGHVVARDSDVNAMFGVDLNSQLPELRAALAGTPAHGFWASTVDNKLMLVGVAPIRSEGRVLGALLVGYDLSNGFAQREADRLGRDVAFVWGDRVYSSSLDGAMPQSLSGVLFGAAQSATVAARDRGEASGIIPADLAGGSWALMIGGLEPSAHLAVVAIADRSTELAKASPIGLLLAFTLLAAVIAVAISYFFGSLVLRAVSTLEEGVLQVINGRADHRIELQNEDFGGLAYRINQLLNVFTGTPESDASVGGTGRWDDQGSVEAAVGGASLQPPAQPAAADEIEADPALAERLLSEGDDAYYARVYGEYVAAKQAAGENVSNLAQDKFVARLKSREQDLKSKRGCRLVRFQVQTRGTQVNLTPVLVR